jgi:hypothetical protein
MRCLGAIIAFLLCVIAGCMSTDDKPTWQKPGLSGGSSAGSSGRSIFDVVTQYDPDSFEYRAKPGDRAVAHSDGAVTHSDDE